MKLDNELLGGMANAFKKSGIKHYFNFPGFYSHILFNSLGGKISSTNEKIAYEEAWGCSQGGKKSLVTFKNVGLNDAADPFINSILTGVGAGLVLVVFDDIELEGSQCVMDSRHYYSFYGGIWLEPYDYKSAVLFSEIAIEISYRFNIPVVIRLTNKALTFKKSKQSRTDNNAIILIKLAETIAGNKFINTNIQPIVHPTNASAQCVEIGSKNELIQLFSNRMHRLLNPLGIRGDVYSGYTEATTDSHICSLPTPKTDLNHIACIHEVGNPVIYNDLKIKNQPTKAKSATLGINLKNASSYIISSRYESLLRLLKVHYKYICGDLGEYTKDNLKSISHCLCFGSAVSVSVGMQLAGKVAVAITGDAAFYHSGKNVLDEAASRKVTYKIVLIDNGGSQGTGGQQIPGHLETGLSIQEIDLDSIDESDLKIAVNEFATSSSARILKVNHKI